MDGTAIQYEALSIRVRTSIDAICTRFETEFKIGRAPKIEEYLQQLEEQYRPSLLRELMVLDLHYRADDARAIRLDYARRFESYADVVDSMVEANPIMSSTSQAVNSTHEFAADPQIADVSLNSENGTRIRGGSDTDPVQQATSPPPTILGRYRIVRVIGQGGFGTVYEAYDGRLKRTVAIKVPRPSEGEQRVRKHADLVEARVLASLDHHGIVPVYDVQKTEDGRYYVVSKLIEGRDLRKTMDEDHPTFERSAEIVASAAEALHHAHARGLIHRDIKPANILIENTGKPYVADFGLALHETERGTQSVIAGTPMYMSPEQARGESHLVTGRSDIFSLGVVLYELLTRHVPFFGNDPRSVLAAISDGTVVPLRQHNDCIPPELEQICLKALAARAADRHESAAELADDLRHFLAAQQEAVEDGISDCPVIPRGLQSYDQDDADFFLKLLPGPRDRHGLPQIVRLLKSKLDPLDAERTFRVGIVYGPSGCGKSSLIKAGVLPRLAEHVVSVYLEATHSTTEQNLLSALHKRLPRADVSLDLGQLLHSVRRDQLLSSGQKLVIVIDQFEQWLHMRSRDESALLIRALRQCDGGRVQCVLLVRDDFWMAASRVMSELDEPTAEHHNAIAVDLFDKNHAEAVLAIFGKACGKLPEDLGDVTRSQRTFLKESVAALAESDRVIPIQLAIFADMMKHKDWSPASLRRMGGIKGVGVTLLDETFVNPTAPHENRVHQTAARCVLERLLPVTGQAIKGHTRSRQELQQVSGYEGHRDEFDRLLHILTRETRLMSPAHADVELTEDQSDATGTTAVHYQLTHDYLVPSIREWLFQDRRNSWQGRAQLRLIQRSDLWHHSQKQRKQLPSLIEWLNIELLTSRSRWTDSQQEMMRRSRALHLAILSTSLMVLVLVATASHQINGRARSRSLVRALKTAETKDVPLLLDQLSPYQRWATPQLEQMLTESSSRKEQLHARLALLPSQPSRLHEVISRVLDPDYVQIDAFLVLRESLQDDLLNQSREHPSITDVARSRHERFRAACLYPNGNRWTAETRKFVAGELIAACETHPQLAQELTGIFHGTRASLTGALEDQFDRDSPAALPAARILASYHADSNDMLITLVLKAAPEQLPVLLDPLLNRHADIARAQLIGQVETDDGDLTPKQYANAVVALFRLGVTDPLWSVLRQVSNPSRTSHVIHAIGRASVNPDPLVAKLVEEQDASVIAAILLSLGGYAEQSSDFHRLQSATLETVRTCAIETADPGVHGAAEWLLRHWGHEAQTVPTDVLANGFEQNGWFVSPTGQAMAVFGLPTLSKRSEARDGPTRDQGRSANRHRFGIGIYEVTNAQFETYAGPRQPDPFDCSDPRCPAARISWYQAAAFCNWLSKQENLQPCYKLIRDEPLQLEAEVDALSRTGYRLPTIREWEYACGAGSTTRWFFGETDDLYGEYAWFSHNTRDLKKRRVGRKKPNGYGIFDMYGNAAEWCHNVVRGKEGYRELRGGAAGDPVRAWTRMSEAGPPNREVPAIGFRTARTMRDKR